MKKIAVVGVAGLAFFLTACGSTPHSNTGLNYSDPNVSPNSRVIEAKDGSTTSLATYQINGTTWICLIWTNSTGAIASSCDWSPK